LYLPPTFSPKTHLSLAVSMPTTENGGVASTIPFLLHVEVFQWMPLSQELTISVVQTLLDLCSTQKLFPSTILSHSLLFLTLSSTSSSTDILLIHFFGFPLVLVLKPRTWWILGKLYHLAKHSAPEFLVHWILSICFSEILNWCQGLHLFIV
jgi:hypothetical protein